MGVQFAATVATHCEQRDIAGGLPNDNDPRHSAVTGLQTMSVR
jgi:hypothetical protein